MVYTSRFIPGVLALLGLSLLNAVPCWAVNTPPNILLVLVDDCSADELGCYGNTAHHTPVIDRLSEQGARFETCWSAPICSPSRAMIMTGRYGFRTSAAWSSIAID